MAKEKQTKRMIAMALAASVVTSAMPITAFADVVTNPDGSTTETTTNADNGTKTEKTTSTSGEGTASAPTVKVEVSIMKDENNTVTEKEKTTTTSSAETDSRGNTTETTTVEQSWQSGSSVTEDDDTPAGDSDGTENDGTTEDSAGDTAESDAAAERDAFVEGFENGTNTTETTGTSGNQTTNQTEVIKGNGDPLEKSGSTSGSEVTTDTTTTSEKSTEEISDGTGKGEWEQVGKDQVENLTPDADFVPVDGSETSGTLEDVPSLGELGELGQISTNMNAADADENGKVTGETTQDIVGTDAYNALVNILKGDLKAQISQKLADNGYGQTDGINDPETGVVTYETSKTMANGDTVTMKVTLTPKYTDGEITGFETVEEEITTPAGESIVADESDADVVKDGDNAANPEITYGDLEETVVEEPTTKVHLPDKPEGGETIDPETGYTNIVTVEPKYRDDDPTKEQIGWDKVTVIKDADGKEVGGGTETIWGEVTTSTTKKEVEQTTTVTSTGHTVTTTEKVTEKNVTTSTVNITAEQRKMWAEMLLEIGEKHGDTALQQLINPSYSMYGNNNNSVDIANDLRPNDWQWVTLEKEVANSSKKIFHKGETPEGGLKFTGYGLWGSLKVADMKVKTDANGNPVTDADGNLVYEARNEYYNAHDTRLYELTNYIKNSDGTISEQKFYGYCAELGKALQRGAYYEIENIGDADYYEYQDPNAKENITAIAINGFWGTESGLGSLQSVKDNLKDAYNKANGDFPLTLNQINNLTPGQALAATQAAIWKYGNASDSGLSMKDVEEDSRMLTAYYGTQYQHTISSANNADNKAVVGLYKYLTNLVGENGTYTPPAGFEETNVFDTEDIVSTSIVAKEKVGEGATEAAEDDVYKTDVNFTLAIVPEGNDNYVVKVFNGTEQVGEDYALSSLKKTNTTDKDGNVTGGTYTIADIPLAEGVNINVNISGVQNLNNGVYLYTSEPIELDNGKTTHSQTFVGLAGGSRKVNLDMNLQFKVDEPTVSADGSYSSSSSKKTERTKTTRNYQKEEATVVALVEVTQETITTTNREWSSEYEETWSYSGNNGNNGTGGGSTTGEETTVTEEPTVPEEVATPETPTGSETIDGKDESSNQADSDEPGFVIGIQEELTNDEELLDAIETAPIAMDVPQTGDDSHAVGFGATALAALAGMFTLKKREKMK